MIRWKVRGILLLGLLAAMFTGRPLAAQTVAQIDAITQQMLTHYNEGRYGDAEVLARQVYDSVEARFKGTVFYPLLMGNAANNLGLVHYAQGRYADAEGMHKLALPLRQQMPGPDSPEVVRSLAALADINRALGKYADAETFALKAVSTSERLRQPDSVLTAAVLNDLAILYLSQGASTRRSRFSHAISRSWNRFRGRTVPIWRSRSTTSA